MISEITAIVYGARTHGHDFVYLSEAQSRCIDKMKEQIAEISNDIAQQYNIPITISVKHGWADL